MERLAMVPRLVIPWTLVIAFNTPAQTQESVPAVATGEMSVRLDSRITPVGPDPLPFHTTAIAPDSAPPGDHLSPTSDPLRLIADTGNQPVPPFPKPYRDTFTNNDFSHLDAADFVSADPFDALKRIGLAPRVLLDVGGEYRMRSESGDNLRLDRESHSFLLQRERLYGDLRCDGWWRAYAESVDATSSFE